ncbi:hypothetical protein C5Y96_21730 [Blastopirellula marina]|uniref:Carboxypeptidase regulatory-like domain-containing protein n=1 Tax=Blastopirellula marina TaxID=124 RepID=A0A2S8F1R3_9BACT|nr:hypothetical protein C5Y96_21730 [Blastopirellula marina]RCS44431.1 hypothetical protein DTL36_21775 [Bremerella cremea]
MDELCRPALHRATNRFLVATLCSVSLVCLTLTGCGQGRTSAGATASGIVTVEGVPLTGGTVAFSPVNSGSSAFGHIQPDGTYHVETDSQTTGLAPGDYQIAIYFSPPETEDAAGNTVVGENPVAKKYADFDRSGLKVTANAGDNKFDFDLDPKKAGRKK